MRLINTVSLELQGFFHEQVPPYAILSHCWGDGEVSHADHIIGQQRPLQDYENISKCCEWARDLDLSWIWVDTCCVDKPSSAELTEAIKSMYRWYSQAAVCFHCQTMSSQQMWLKPVLCI